jgi:hypothetical protein
MSASTSTAGGDARTKSQYGSPYIAHHRDVQQLKRGRAPVSSAARGRGDGVAGARGAREGGWTSGQGQAGRRRFFLLLFFASPAVARLVVLHGSLAPFRFSLSLLPPPPPPPPQDRQGRPNPNASASLAERERAAATHRHRGLDA